MINTQKYFVTSCAFVFLLLNTGNNIYAAQRDTKQVRTASSTSLFKKLFSLWAGLNLIGTCSARQLSLDEKITLAILNTIDGKEEFFYEKYTDKPLINTYKNTASLLDFLLAHPTTTTAQRQVYYEKYFEGLDLDDANKLLRIYLEQYANTKAKRDEIKNAYANYLYKLFI